MKRLLSHPATNAVCVSVFSAYYALLMVISSSSGEFIKKLNYHNGGRSGFWAGWSRFLLNGNQIYIAYAMLAVTALVVVLLSLRRQPYDEYHTSILIRCLIAALVLTLMTIAVFYVSIIIDPTGVVEKFTLFAVMNWTTVVFSDLAYIVICRRS